MEYHQIKFGVSVVAQKGIVYANQKDDGVIFFVQGMMYKLNNSNVASIRHKDKIIQIKLSNEIVPEKVYVSKNEIIGNNVQSIEIQAANGIWDKIFLKELVSLKIFAPTIYALDFIIIVRVFSSIFS